jgi:hypothetical protein
MAVVYWYITLPAVAFAGSALAAKKYRDYVNRPGRVIVNRYDSTAAVRVRDNIIGMITEG